MKLKRIFIFISFFALLFPIVAFPQDNMGKFTLVIHGGAGTISRNMMTPELEKEYSDKLYEALTAGFQLLKAGGSSLDAVETTIKVLEDSPLFNAGKGSVFTAEGKNEMDASIMEGKNLNAGAVAAINTIKNPISAARLVMEKSPHVLMTGPGAILFAKKNGLTIVDSSYFYTDFRYEQWLKIKNQDTPQLDHSGDSSIKGKGGYNNIQEQKKYGTVGAVAKDIYGNLAAGTSTGGMTNKKWGRIGDSPIIGAGTYANNKTCAVSSTGHGEYFIRSVVAYDISALMEYKKMTVQKAAEEVVLKKLVEMGGEGGVIAVDKDGNVAMPFNSEGMYRGYVKEDGEVKVWIYKE